ncbi:S8 family serine peptidase [Nocardioides sp.]|uniref:S8 family serine peptidase n=1 Tax=Nocardioides sp. TaxID=35761 RepID=UPI00351131BF
MTRVDAVSRRTRVAPAVVAVVTALLLGALAAPSAEGVRPAPARPAGAPAAVPPASTAHVPVPRPRPTPSLLRWRGAPVSTTGGVAVRPPRLTAPPQASGRQLRVVQFRGPTRPAWYAALARLGRVVTYLPDHAYLVWTTAEGAARLARRAARPAWIRYSGPVDPFYRLAPGLRRRPPADAGPVDVTVQVVAGRAGRSVLAAVLRGRRVLAPASELGGLVTASVRVPAAAVATIARRAAVVNVEPFLARSTDDEAQGQLLAGNSGVVDGRLVPDGPGYLDWLTGLGFPTDPAQYPVVAVVDDGIDNGSVVPTHPDLFELGDPAADSRISVNDNCSTDATAVGTAGHGTLNAGIVGGYTAGTGPGRADGAGYRYGLGVAPFGRLSGVKIFSDAGSYSISRCGGTDAGVAATVAGTGATISSNSWGSNVGGAYDATARAYDLLTRDAVATRPGDQQLLHVISAGNAGSAANTIGSPGTAKNGLTVGATEGVRDDGEPDGCGIADADDAADLAAFSSRGPTDDGRIKPDLVAAGTHLEGLASLAPGADGSGVCGPVPAGRFRPAGQTLYTWSSGTSHSTPAVAGAAALAQNYYGRVLAPGLTASPAMLKALLLGTADHLDGQDTGGPLPSPTQGWGAPDLGTLFDPDPHGLLIDQTTVFAASGQRVVRTGTVHDPAEPVRVTLVWTDAAGPTTGDAYVNDLDLEVVVEGRTYRGNVTGPDGVSLPGGGPDRRNNVESVRLPAGLSGPVAVRVVAHNIAGDALPHDLGDLQQDFALTATNLDEATVEVPAGAGLTATDTGGDGAAAPGEVLTVEAAISNAGTAPLPRGTGTLRVVSGPATVLDGVVGYPVVDPGEVAVGRRSHVVRLDPGTDCATPVVLEHTWRGGGRTVVQTLEVPVGSPRPARSIAATAVPVAVPDNAPGIEVPLEVPASAADPTAGRVVVSVRISHTYVGDLELALRSPAGTVVPLLTRVGGTGDDLVDTRFSDDADAPPPAVGAPYTGTYLPASPLAAVRGEAPAGTWRLRVTDTAAGDTGSVLGWTLTTRSDAVTCPPSSPSVLVAPPVPVGEGDLLDVPVTLLDPDGASQQVTLAMVDGTATAPDDFDGTPVTVSWGPGDPLTQHVRVPIVADGATEPEETFEVAVASSSVPANGPVTARILAVPPTLAIGDDVTATEGDTVRVPVTLTDPDPDTTYRVRVATAARTASAADVVTVARTLTWAPGDPATQQVALTLRRDAAAEPAEVVALVLSDPEHAQVARAEAQVRILDAPPAVRPVLTVAPARVVEGDRGTRRLVFRVSLDRAGTAPITLTWRTRPGTATAGTDYTTVRRRVTLAPGTRRARWVVPVRGDTRVERDETLRIAVVGLTGATLRRGAITGTIRDDDRAGRPARRVTPATPGA